MKEKKYLFYIILQLILVLVLFTTNLESTFSQKTNIYPVKKMTLVAEHHEPVIGHNHADVITSNNRSGL